MWVRPTILKNDLPLIIVVVKNIPPMVDLGFWKKRILVLTGRKRYNWRERLRKEVSNDISAKSNFRDVALRLRSGQAAPREFHL
jgi:hypothetical protein